MHYVKTDNSVGILVRTDTRQDKPYRVKDKHTGQFDSFASVETITDEAYAEHQPVATTKKPARGKKT